MKVGAGATLLIEVIIIVSQVLSLTLVALRWESVLSLGVPVGTDMAGGLARPGPLTVTWAAAEGRAGWGPSFRPSHRAGYSLLSLSDKCFFLFQQNNFLLDVFKTAG
jgi:hypothetical protein